MSVPVKGPDLDEYFSLDRYYSDRHTTLDNPIALEYTLAKQGQVCSVVSISYST